MSDYHFFNWPIPYKQADYDEVNQKIIEKYKNTKGLVSIYEWGSISNPGISDIDIVLVFNDEAKSLPISKRSFYIANKKTRYLACHPFVHIWEKDFQNIGHIYQNALLTSLYGEEIEIAPVAKNESFFIDVATLNDIIIRHYPRDFIVQEVKKTINVRDTLLRLNSLKYTVAVLERIAKKKIAGSDAILRDISRLRSGWFDANDTKLLQRLNTQALSLTLNIIECFDLLLQKYIARSAKEQVSYSGIKNRADFILNWNQKEAKKEMLHMARKNQYRSVLPLTLAAQLGEYSKINGPISHYIKKSLSTAAPTVQQNQLRSVIQRRIGILNNQARLAAILRHSDFAAFFDLGCRNKKGVNNWILNVWDKVKY